MSKRKGTMVTLQELVDEVGSDAARYTLISKSSNQMVDFDIEAVKKRDNSNPVYYVQYAHARVCSILRRAADVTAEQAAEVCTSIRTTVRHLYGARIARSITIQYGGSMKPGNAAELLAQPDIDGGLIGGASLKPADFVEIINAANQD